MRAVHFDLDGTLVELSTDYGDVFEAALADVGVDAAAEHAEHYTNAFRGYFVECHPNPYRPAMADLREAFDLQPTVEELADALVARELAATELRPGVREVLDALDAPDCSLGVLTNGVKDVQRGKLARNDIADRFDAIVVSGAVGAAKPEPEIFAAAEEALPADERVFVADDLERDVVPAQQAGFTGVYLADADDDECVNDRADHAVSSLGEVPTVLE